MSRGSKQSEATRLTTMPFVLSLLLSFFIAPLCLSGTPQPEIIISAGDPWPPYIDDKHPHQGVSVEIANAAFATQGFRIKQIFVPWARAIEGTRTGSYDLILDAWWSPERSKAFMFSKPYLKGAVKLIKRKDYPFTFDGLKSLKGKQVAVVRGYAYDYQFMTSDLFERFEVMAFENAIGMLLHERVDFAIEDESVTRYRLKNTAPEKLALIEFVSPPVSVNLIYIMSGYSNPRHYEYIQAFNRGLEILIKNGKYASILRRNGLTDHMAVKSKTEPD